MFSLFNSNSATFKLQKEKTMKFVVIGADAAGMSAASRAKRNQPEMEITVLEKTMDVSYSA
jgi:predicted flavoprotein YhiN